MHALHALSLYIVSNNLINNSLAASSWLIILSTVIVDYCHCHCDLQPKVANEFHYWWLGKLLINIVDVNCTDIHVHISAWLGLLCCIFNGIKGMCL